MTIKKSLIIAGGTTVIAATLVAGIAGAQGTNGSTLVDKIAQRFNLKKADVQQVFDQNKQEHQADREAKYEARLDQAVKDGKLTADQKTKILAKHKELLTQLETQKDALKDKTPAERRTAMEQKRAEITQWEKDNNIPTGYLGLFGPGMRGRGMHRGGKI